jgi:hypothetical protein
MTDRFRVSRVLHFTRRFPSLEVEKIKQKDLHLGEMGQAMQPWISLKAVETSTWQ